MKIRRGFIILAIVLGAPPVTAQTVVERQTGIPNATFVPRYSPAERAKAAQAAFGLSAPPTLGPAVSLTPNALYAPDGSRLSFWKPSFVIGTAGGGEAGFNFWGVHVRGHVNVGFTPRSATVLDCRMLSAGNITYEIYAGDRATEQGEVKLRDGHFLLRVAAANGPVSVELWPTPVAKIAGFFGCDLGEID